MTVTVSPPPCTTSAVQAPPLVVVSNGLLEASPYYGGEGGDAATLVADQHATLFVDTASYRAQPGDPGTYYDDMARTERPAWLRFTPTTDAYLSIAGLADYPTAVDIWEVDAEGALQAVALNRPFPAVMHLHAGDYRIAVRDVSGLGGGYYTYAWEYDATFYGFDSYGPSEPDGGPHFRDGYDLDPYYSGSGPWYEGGLPSIAPHDSGSSQTSAKYTGGAALEADTLYDGSGGHMAGLLTSAMTFGIFVEVGATGEEQWLGSRWVDSGWRLSIGRTGQATSWDLVLTLLSANMTATELRVPIGQGVHHVGFTFDAGDVILYLDGEPVASGTGPVSTLSDAIAPRIGGGGIRDVGVRVDGAYLVDRALNGREMRTLALTDFPSALWLDVHWWTGRHAAWTLPRTWVGRLQFRLATRYNIGGIGTSLLETPYTIGDPGTFRLVAPFRIWGPVWKHLECPWMTEGATRVDLSTPYIIEDDSSSPGGGGDGAPDLVRGLFFEAE